MSLKSRSRSPQYLNSLSDAESLPRPSSGGCRHVQRRQPHEDGGGGCTTLERRRPDRPRALLLQRAALGVARRRLRVMLADPAAYKPQGFVVYSDHRASFLSSLSRGWLEAALGRGGVTLRSYRAGVFRAGFTSNTMVTRGIIDPLDPFAEKCNLCCSVFMNTPEQPSTTR